MSAINVNYDFELCNNLKENNITEIMRLIERGADPNIHNTEHCNALYYIITDNFLNQLKKKQYIEYLMSKGLNSKQQFVNDIIITNYIKENIEINDVCQKYDINISKYYNFPFGLLQILFTEIML